MMPTAFDGQLGSRNHKRNAPGIAFWEHRCLRPRLPPAESSVERLVSPCPGRKELSRGLMESMMAAAEPASGESRSNAGHDAPFGSMALQAKACKEDAS
jgi:hypothetical protein